MKRYFLVFLVGLGLVAGPCEDKFAKSGNPMTGTKYTAAVTVEGLTVADAMAQMHGIAVGKKLDILTEDVANGNMLLEYRESFRNKAIPYVVSVFAEGGSATVQMLVKLNKGAFAKAEDVRGEMCSMLGAVKGGAEGRAAAAQGAQAVGDGAPRKVDALKLSLELARQNQESAESIPLRYKNRAFTVTGRVDYVIKNGERYRVAFSIPEPRDMALPPMLGAPSYKIDISCLMAPSHTAWAIALRPGEKIALTGKYEDYDQFKRVMWLGGCRPE